MKKFFCIMVSLAFIGVLSSSAPAKDKERFEVRTHAGGVETVFDNETGLEWEIKVDCGGADLSNPRCNRNRYRWYNEGTTDDGTLFTDFLAKLNNSKGSVSADGNTLNPSGCYAGHCDWRIPDIRELRSIIDSSRAGCGSGAPCIAEIFGPTSVGDWWFSSTTKAWGDQTCPTEDSCIYGIRFDLSSENLVTLGKTTQNYARAVRGGR